MWEIDALNFIPRIMQDHVALKRDSVQMRRQQCKVVWRQSRQETIGSSEFKLPGRLAKRHKASLLRHDGEARPPSQTEVPPNIPDY